MFEQVRFETTAVAPKGYPIHRDSSGRCWPEIAVAGRSNVGKSTLLNHLFNRKKLVKTSSTPGKTQHLNFFSIDEKISFVDLPGYGYADVPESVRRKWGPMIQTYLDSREELSLILFLIDIRRTPNQDDLRFFDWLVARDKAVILVLTKCDKVRRNERDRNTKKILATFNAENLHTVHYSAAKNLGRDQLIRSIKEALQDESEPDEEEE